MGRLSSPAAHQQQRVDDFHQKKGMRPKNVHQKWHDMEWLVWYRVVHLLPDAMPFE